MHCRPLEGQPSACPDQRSISQWGGYGGVTMLLLCLTFCLLASPTATATTQTQQVWEVHLLKITSGYKEYKCIKKLIFKESSNNPHAVNGSHYGLAQGRTQYLRTATPTAQITWMMKYVRARYNDGCAALKHSNVKGWY